MKRMLAALLLVLSIVSLFSAGCGEEPPPPGEEAPPPPTALANAELVAVYPSPGSTLTVLDRVTLEFSAPIKDCRVGGLLRGTVPRPTISGSTLTWEIGATAPSGLWTAAVVGDVVFEGALPLHIQESWRFSLEGSPGPANITGGSPANRAIRSKCDVSFAVTVDDKCTLLDTPNPGAKIVWEGPPGVLVQLGESADGYVKVSAPAPDVSPLFTGDGPRIPPLPTDGGYIALHEIWVIPQLWLPDAAATVVHVQNQRPRFALTLPGVAETTTQFTVPAREVPTAHAVDAAVAYVLFSRMYQTVLHVPAPSTDEVQVGLSADDVDFLVEQTRQDIEVELSYVRSLPWPVGLDDLRDRFLRFGAMCADASASVVGMMNPTTAADCRSRLAAIIEEGGLTAPGPDAQLHEWGEAAQSALNNIAEDLRAVMMDMMAPGLMLWQPDITE